MRISADQPAPAFTLKDTDKKDVSLSDYKGKNVLLLFFPLAFTGTCTKELCGIRDTMKEYKDLNAEVLAVSVDSLFVLGVYKANERYNFTFLSDFNKEVSRAYGTLHEDFFHNMKGVSKRSAFVIDKEGIIRYAEVLEIASELPDFTKIKAVLKSLNQ